MADVQRDSYRRRVAYFVTPIAAGMAMIVANAVIVPRQRVYDFMGVVDPALAKLNASVLVAGYHYAIAATVTVIAALFVIGQCLLWQVAFFRSEQWDADTAEFANVEGLTLLALTLVALVEDRMVDDGAAIYLYHLVNAATLNTWSSPLTTGRVLGYVILATFIVAAATTAVAATSGRREAPNLSNMEVVRATLLLSSVVMLAAMVAMKFRWEMSQQMLPMKIGDNPNPGFVAYQMATNAIATYWSAILSVGLACLYGFPAIRLYERFPAAETPAPLPAGQPPRANGGLPWLSTEAIGRLFRAVAILSPPLVAHLIDLFQAAPKSG